MTKAKKHALTPKLRSLLLSLIFLLLISALPKACVPQDKSEVVGTYVADYDIAKETITLNQDGTYSQEVTIKATSQINRINGTWSYDYDNDVVFQNNFISVLNFQGKLNYQQERRLVILPVTKVLGFIFIENNDYIRYRKLSSGK